MNLNIATYALCLSMMAVAADQPIISDAALGQWGYRSLSLKVATQSQWELETFGEAKKVEQQIKAVNETRPGSQTYARFMLRAETYGEPAQAVARIEALRVKVPPGVTTKMYPEWVLTSAFAHGNGAYIVSTDVLAFSQEIMPKVVEDYRTFIVSAQGKARPIPTDTTSSP